MTLEPPPRPPSAEEILRWRQASGMSQSECAQRAHVSEKTWRSWEKGHTTPQQGAALIALRELMATDPARYR